MKRIFLMSFMVLCTMLFSAMQAEAKLFGISIKFEKGTKEWNAAHTATECVGKGFCRIDFSANVDIPATLEANGTLGYDETGTLALSTDPELLTDGTWSDTFVNGFVTINKDIILDEQIRSRINNCPNIIRAGKYAYKINRDELIVYFK